MHNKNKMQNNRQNPTMEEITYRISGKGKSWSYEYGKLYPGRYSSSRPQPKAYVLKYESDMMLISLKQRTFNWSPNVPIFVSKACAPPTGPASSTFLILLLMLRVFPFYLLYYDLCRCFLSY